MKSETGKPRMRSFMRVFSFLLLLLALARTVSLWATDPMLAYANGWDHIRTTHAFGLQPQNTGLYTDAHSQM